jgi:hypothetical protein
MIKTRGTCLVTEMKWLTFLAKVQLSDLHIQGRIQGGGGPSPKIGKNMIFWRKIVIFHTKYPNIFRASLRNWKEYYFLA